MDGTLNPQGAPAGPLAGTLVLHLSRALAGPHATIMLADLGARVIKAESPDSGDGSRSWVPLLGQHSDAVRAWLETDTR